MGACYNAFVSLCTRKLHHSLKMSQDYSEIVYKSLDSVLEHLKKPEYSKLNGVQQLLNVYSALSKSKVSKEEKKYPLVVLEGLDGCGKSTQTRRVTNALNAELRCTPPSCIKDIRDQFDSPEYKDVRTAYYALGNYIAAIEIITLLKNGPVVLDRFWHSTASYALAQAIADDPKITLPSENHEIYKWPEDLLVPDFIGFLCVSEEVRLNRIKNRPELTNQEHLLQAENQFRANVLATYNRISPKFHPINAQLSKRKVQDQILVHVRPLLPENWQYLE